MLTRGRTSWILASKACDLEACSYTKTRAVPLSAPFAHSEWRESSPEMDTKVLTIHKTKENKIQNEGTKPWGWGGKKGAHTVPTGEGGQESSAIHTTLKPCLTASSFQMGSRNEVIFLHDLTSLFISKGSYRLCEKGCLLLYEASMTK